MIKNFQTKVDKNQFIAEIKKEQINHEKDFFADGNFDYYSKSKSKKYRASKFRMI